MQKVDPGHLNGSMYAAYKFPVDRLYADPVLYGG
jgi:hypothetical protein